MRDQFNRFSSDVFHKVALLETVEECPLIIFKRFLCLSVLGNAFCWSGHCPRLPHTACEGKCLQDGFS